MVLCKVFHDTYKAYLLKVALSSSLELQSFKENSVLELIVDRKPPIREHANIRTLLLYSVFASVLGEFTVEYHYQLRKRSIVLFYLNAEMQFATFRCEDEIPSGLIQMVTCKHSASPVSHFNWCYSFF